MVSKDLTFIHLGNETTVEGLVNFEKLRMLAKEASLDHSAYRSRLLTFFFYSVSGPVTDQHVLRTPGHLDRHGKTGERVLPKFAFLSWPHPSFYPVQGTDISAMRKLNPPPPSGSATIRRGTAVGGASASSSSGGARGALNAKKMYEEVGVVFNPDQIQAAGVRPALGM